MLFFLSYSRKTEMYNKKTNKMKTFRILFAFVMLAVASFMMVACDKDDPPASPPEPKPEVDVTFEIEVTEITSTSAMVTVTPSRDDALYFFDNISKEELMKSYNGDAAARTEYAFEYFTSSERPIEEVVAAYASQGEDDFFYSMLSPDTDYVIYAVPISSEGKALGAGATYSYRTQKEDE